MSQTKKVDNTQKEKWVIKVGGGYGAFFFEGEEWEAEEMRKHKARWERAIANKRRADDAEINTGLIDSCNNHPGYNRKAKIHCECPNCMQPQSN